MPALSTVLIPDTLRSIDSATFTGNYQAVGAALSNGARIVKFTNNSSVQITISWDGINDNEILPANSFLLLDISANRENTCYLEIKVGTQFYAKGASGTGSLYISVYYGT